ncbi:hypothetical protein ACRZ5S_22520 (plasmid) [Vibrio scophthalmi]|uniref:hypothetical protein n=1 Tax=Vibrio scophthalmi TaxID=45658 RepID=UPI003EB9281C
MKPFGFYGHADVLYPLDVADTQRLLPKGARIRNKQKKRRVHKKAMRRHLRSLAIDAQNG